MSINALHLTVGAMVNELDAPSAGERERRHTVASNDH
jgi:hypothetical protein